MERLAKAKELGAIPVDFSEGDPVEQIFARREGCGGKEGVFPFPLADFFENG